MDVVLGVIAVVVLANVVVVIALVRKYLREQRNERVAHGNLRSMFLTKEDVTLAR